MKYLCEAESVCVAAVCVCHYLLSPQGRTIWL